MPPENYQQEDPPEMSSSAHIIPTKYLNSFGFIDYKHDGSVPWADEDKGEVFLSDQYTSVTDFLGIDCEMVGIGHFKTDVLGRVSIINAYGFCIYDKFVKPMEKITDYRTQTSGIRPEYLIGGK